MSDEVATKTAPTFKSDREDIIRERNRNLVFFCRLRICGAGTGNPRCAAEPAKRHTVGDWMYRA